MPEKEIHPHALESEIPVVSFIGWSGAGKTTFLEKLIPVLRGEGLRLAVIKHDGHDFQVDREGKDTWRFTQAGAECVAIANDRHAAMMEQRYLSFRDLISRTRNVDLILTEGWNEPGIPKIEVLRNGRDLRCECREELLAVITDGEAPAGVPVIPLEGISEAAALILNYCAGKNACRLAYARKTAAGHSPEDTVSLTVGGKEVALLPFVQNIIRSVNLGLVSTLKDTEIKDGDEIIITLRKTAVNGSKP